MTKGTQRYKASSGENDRFTTKRGKFGAVRDHLVEAGLAKMMRDVVRCVEGDKCGDVLEAKETLWKAEKEPNSGITRGHASAAQRLRGGVFTY